jgi:2-polyprenyl-6-methoxyphenol hydroxylase-like FAD-dependent oxidoreductase
MHEPVIVVGGGPVGLMLACELRLGGVETVLLERQAQPDGRSPGTAINAAVVELLAQRGLMEPLRGVGVELPRAHFAHIWMDPTRLAERHPYTYVVPHALLRQALAQRAAGLGAQLRLDSEVLAVTQEAGSVTVDLVCAGERQTLRGSYVVGCDGAASAVRAAAGIDFPGVDYRFHGLIGDLEAEAGSPLFGLLGINQREAGFITVAPMGGSLLRVATGEFDVAPADDAAPPDAAELVESIRRITGLQARFSAAPWLTRWNTPTRQAQRYRDGRIFLAGDAAHVHFPLGGQALSTGIEDAVNLGWKLAAQLRGWAPANLLDTYHEERHPVGARACLTTRAQVALLHPMERVGPLRDILTELIRFEEVNEYLVRMVGGLDVRYPVPQPEAAAGTPHPLLGCRLADQPLTTAAGAGTTVAELLRPARGVLLDLSGGLAGTEALGGWSDRVDVVVAKSTGPLDAAVLLLRPDGRVVWADPSGTDGEGLRSALGAWFGEPAGG